MKNSLLRHWEKYCSGDRESFGSMYSELYRELMLFCLGLTKDQGLAENVATDAFIKLYEQPTIPPIQNPRAWLYTVCKRDISTWWMTNNRRKEILHQVKDRFQTEETSLAEKHFETEQIENLNNEK